MSRNPPGFFLTSCAQFTNSDIQTNVHQGLCLSTFVVALDNTIIGRFGKDYLNYNTKLTTCAATAIPKITSVFNSLEDVGWYGSSYLLTTTALQPSFGRIYTVGPQNSL